MDGICCPVPGGGGYGGYGGGGGYSGGGGGGGGGFGGMGALLVSLQLAPLRRPAAMTAIL